LYRFPGGIPADTTHFNVTAGETFHSLLSSWQAVGGAGLITVDYGSGSPQEAAAELAYLQGSADRHHGSSATVPSGMEPPGWNQNWQTVGYWASLRAATPLATNDGLNFLRINHSAPFATIDDLRGGQRGIWLVGARLPHQPAQCGHLRQFSATFYSYAQEITAAAGLPMISIGLGSDDPSASWTRTVIGR